MQELVQNSEQYLTQQQHQQIYPHENHHQKQQQTQHCKEESDSEGSHISSLDSDAPGQLKHSDSLLLLTQVLNLNLQDRASPIIEYLILSHYLRDVAEK